MINVIDKIIDHEGDTQEMADRQLLKQEFLENETEDEIFAFRIMTNSDEEFYTKDTPQILGQNIIISNAVQKCTAQAQILSTILEQFYSVVLSGDIEFPLDEGIVLKRVPIIKLDWFETSKETAEAVLKDEVLMYYQTVVPELMKKVAALEQRHTYENDEPGPGPLIRKKNDLRL